MWGPWVLEILREFRVWQPSVSPVGLSFLILLCLSFCAIGFCCGALAVGLLLSGHCRRVVGCTLRFLASTLEVPARPQVELGGVVSRFREYRE